MKEESLTDWLLYILSENCNSIFYYAFSRYEESTIGADWEWWVLTKSNNSSSHHAYRFLVQAKKLKNNVDNYPLISYSNKNGIQMDLLINSAKERNAMPLYAFYSTVTARLEEQIKVFPSHISLLKWCEACKNGCYLSSALTIHDLVFGQPRKHISESTLVNCSFGLSICDYPFVNNCVLEILNEINDLYKQSQETKGRFSKHSNIDGIKHHGNSVPNYVDRIIRYNKQENQNEGLDWIADEFRNDLQGIAGVGVIDLRDLDENEVKNR